jgi:hypothetical protein
LLQVSVIVSIAPLPRMPPQTYTALVLNKKVDPRGSTFGKLMHDLRKIDYIKEISPRVVIDQFHFFSIDLGSGPSWS